MSGDGGNPPSLRDLLGAYEKSGLGAVDAGLVFYSFRHHFISARLAAGVPMFTVARMAGHKSVAMIEQHYGHVCEQHQDEAVDVVSEAINRTSARVAV